MSDASKAAARKRGRDRRVSGANGKPTSKKLASGKSSSRKKPPPPAHSTHPPAKPTAKASARARLPPLGRAPATAAPRGEQATLPHVEIQFAEQHDQIFDRDSWTTPADVLAAVLTATRPGETLGGARFDLDPCSNERSIVPAIRSFRLPIDGLAEPWLTPIEYTSSRRWCVWINPPFSKPIPWIRKAKETIADALQRREDGLDQDVVIVGILKSDTSTATFRALDQASLIFPGRRVCYGGSGDSPPFASLLWVLSTLTHEAELQLAETIAWGLQGRAVPRHRWTRPEKLPRDVTSDARAAGAPPPASNLSTFYSRLGAFLAGGDHPLEARSPTPAERVASSAFLAGDDWPPPASPEHAERLAVASRTPLSTVRVPLGAFHGEPEPESLEAIGRLCGFDVPDRPSAGGSGTPQSLASEATHSANVAPDRKKRTVRRMPRGRGKLEEGSEP